MLVSAEPGNWEEGTRGGFGLSLHQKSTVILRRWKLVSAVSLRDFPFPLQAFPTGEGTDFRSDRCSEGDLPGALQRLHGAAPAAPEPAGSGDRAQGTGPHSVLWLHGHRDLRVWKRFCLVVCLVATGRSQPTNFRTCMWSPSLLFRPRATQSIQAGVVPGGQAGASQVNGRVVLGNGFHQSSALCTRVGLLMWWARMEMDLGPGNGPLSKSVASEECPLSALTAGGSVSQAGDTRRWVSPDGCLPVWSGVSQVWLSHD